MIKLKNILIEQPIPSATNPVDIPGVPPIDSKIDRTDYFKSGPYVNGIATFGGKPPHSSQVLKDIERYLGKTISSKEWEDMIWQKRDEWKQKLAVKYKQYHSRSSFERDMEKAKAETRIKSIYKAIDTAAGKWYLNSGTDEVAMANAIEKIKNYSDFQRVDQLVRIYRGGNFDANGKKAGLINLIDEELNNSSWVIGNKSVEALEMFGDTLGNLTVVGRIYDHLNKILEGQPEYKQLYKLPNWTKYVIYLRKGIQAVKKGYNDTKSWVKDSLATGKGSSHPVIRAVSLFTYNGFKSVDDELQKLYGKQYHPGTLRIVFPGNEVEMQLNIAAMQAGIIDMPFRTIEEGWEYVEALAKAGKKYNTVYVGSHGFGIGQSASVRFLEQMDKSTGVQIYKQQLLTAIKKVIKPSGTVFFSACNGANELYALADAAKIIGVKCQGAAGYNNPFTQTSDNGYYESSTKTLAPLYQIKFQLKKDAETKDDEAVPKKWKPWEFKYDTQESKQPIKLKSLISEGDLGTFYIDDRKKINEDPINKYLLDNNIVKEISSTPASSLGILPAFISLVKYVGIGGATSK